MPVSECFVKKARLLSAAVATASFNCLDANAVKRNAIHCHVKVSSHFTAMSTLTLCWFVLCFCTCTNVTVFIKKSAFSVKRNIQGMRV